MTQATYDPALAIRETPRRSRASVRGYDWLLRFEPRIAAGYEASLGEQRKTELARAILIGLILYNAFFMTSILLMPDNTMVNFVARALIVTPASLLLIWVIRLVSLETAEWLVTFGMLNAFFAMIYLVWTSQAPLASYAHAELTLILVFGAFTLNLRFRHCMVFLTVSSLGSLALVQAMPDLVPDLRAALRMQTLAAFLFCAYGNLQTDLARVRGFVRTWQAGERANDMTALSLRDPLTGLANRRALERQTADWCTSADPVALIMVDIDHFKLYNDTLGHPAGDACLRRVADTLAAALGDTDACLARIGGEEFAIALRGPPALEADRLSERLRDRVAGAALPHTGLTDGAGIVTISLGTASPRPGTGTTLSDLLTAADRALYTAKRLGRNRVVVEGRATAPAA